MTAFFGLVALGLVVGAFGTLIGAGGGFLLVPILALMYPKEEPEVIASISLAVVFFNALSGSIGYARMRRIDYKAGLAFSAASVPGAVLGAITTAAIERATFDILLGIVLLGASVFMFAVAGRAHRAEAEERGRPKSHRRLALGVAISFVVGYVSTLLGIGGGVIHVPLLVFALGFPVHMATATSHFVLALTALAGTLSHVAAGAFHRGVVRTTALSVGVLVGAQIGAHLSKRTHPVLIIRGLAVALAVVGARIIWQRL